MSNIVPTNFKMIVVKSGTINVTPALPITTPHITITPSQDIPDIEIDFSEVLGELKLEEPQNKTEFDSDKIFDNTDKILPNANINKDKPAQTKLSENIEKELRNLVSQGLSRADIAKKMGRSTATINNYLHTLGLSTKKEHTMEEIEEIRKQNPGITVMEICRQLHIALPTYYKIKNEAKNQNKTEITKSVKSETQPTTENKPNTPTQESSSDTNFFTNKPDEDKTIQISSPKTQSELIDDLEEILLSITNALDNERINDLYTKFLSIKNFSENIKQQCLKFIQELNKQSSEKNVKFTKEMGNIREKLEKDIKKTANLENNNEIKAKDFPNIPNINEIIKIFPKNISLQTKTEYFHKINQWFEKNNAKNVDNAFRQATEEELEQNKKNNCFTTYSLQSFMQEFNNNNDTEKLIINWFIKYVYLQNRTETIATGGNNRKAKVIITPKAKQEAYKLHKNYDYFTNAENCAKCFAPKKGGYGIKSLFTNNNQLKGQYELKDSDNGDRFIARLQNGEYIIYRFLSTAEKKSGLTNLK